MSRDYRAVLMVDDDLGFTLPLAGALASSGIALGFEALLPTGKFFPPEYAAPAVRTIEPGSSRSIESEEDWYTGARSVVSIRSRATAHT